MNKKQQDKAALREHYRKMRDKMTVDYKHSLDIDIASRLLCTREYMDANTVLIYIAKSTEVETRGIIHAAFANRKQVAVPKCEGEGVMDFYLITSMDDLKEGCFGIMEPDTDKCRKLTDFKGSLCVVPGLSFDPQGQRLGLGGGYYDRFLSTYIGVSLGLCYSSFIKWNLPHEEHDVPVNLLITDRYTRHIADK